VSLRLNRAQRYADLTVRGPAAGLPADPAEIHRLGDAYWPLQAYRELDAALLHLRLNEPETGLVCLRTVGAIDDVLAVDQTLAANRDHWLVREIILHMARVLRRLDLTAKSFFALIEPGSCFAGNLLELALAADRTYMLNDPAAQVAVATGSLNAGALPMHNGLTRLQSRFLARPEQAAEALGGAGGRRFDTASAEAALTGMEASLRFAGPETVDTKIYGRLTAWQNWIFQRPNAVGEHGALTNYGKPTQPKFDYKRT
jgi:benzoyl-CoA-dihydrodiol lyase